MLVHVLMLVVFVDGHLHATDLGQHHLTHSGLHHEVDPGDRIVAEHQLVQLGCHSFGTDAGQPRGHLFDCHPDPRCDGKAQLRHETRGAKHPQWVVAKRHRRRRRGIQYSGAQRRQTA